jgi:predicted alpha/beta superfamily hydrolase
MWEKLPRAPDAAVYHVDAPLIGDRLEITVVEPFPGARTSGRKFPTIYLLDPAGTLDIVVGTKRLFDIFSQGALPLTYIVGIGYADTDIEGRRFRDFTPTDAQLPAGIEVRLPFGLGGASRYLETIKTLVLPQLESFYPFDTGQRALLGYSLSGRFVAYVLFANPDLFARYLAISPSLWWDNASVFRDEEAWANTHSDLPAKVLFVVGDAEETPGGGWRNSVPESAVTGLRQVSHLRDLADRLAKRGYRSLNFQLAFIPNGRHITVFPAALGLGLVDLFGL